jgi:hypothetical protein
MSSYRKFIAVPENMETNEENFDRVVVTKRRSLDRFSRMLKIGLKLSNINAFDDDFRIKREDNTVVSNSNLLILLNHLMTNGKVLNGLNELIYLMAKAKIDPELVINENVKAKLIFHTKQQK